MIGFEPTQTEKLKDIIRRNAASRAQTIDRQAICDMVMQVFRNDFGDLVESSLRSMFTPENFANLNLFPHTATNLMADVLDDLCVLYQEPPQRMLRGLTVTQADASGDIGDLLEMDDEELLSRDVTPGAPESESDDGAEAQAFERYCRLVDPDSLFDTLHRLATVMPVVWGFPVVRERPGATGPDDVYLTVDIYTPANANVKFSKKDPKVVESFYTWREVQIDDKPGNTEFRYFEWTRDEYRVCDKNWHVLSSAPNPLKRLPVFEVRLGRPVDGYFLDGQGGDLYDGTLEVCVLRTLQNARYRDSSFKQLVIDGSPDDVPADQVIGNPCYPIYTPEGSASLIDMQANLQQMTEVVRDRIKDIKDKYGITPSVSGPSQKGQSGYSKKMDNSKILRINRKHRKFMAQAEADCYRLCAMRLEANPVDDIGALPADAEFAINYSDPGFEEAPLTQAKTDVVNMKLGVTSLLAIMKRIDPDLTDSEAIQQLALNRKINERFLYADKQGNTMADILAAAEGGKAGGDANGGGDVGGGNTGGQQAGDTGRSGAGGVPA